MNSLATFAERLKWARKSAGFSTYRLDRIAGITPGHTLLIESGRRVHPRTDTAAALARALGVSLDWLIDGQGPPPAARAS